MAVMGHTVRFAVCAVLLLFVCSSANGQRDDNDSRPDIGELFRELAVDIRGSELLRVSNSYQEGMRILEHPDLPGLSVNRTLAVLAVEQPTIGKLISASETHAYLVPEPWPQDPYDSTSITLSDSSSFRGFARVLSIDTIRCWMDGDFDGALIRVATMLRFSDMLIGSRDEIGVLTGAAIRSMAMSRLETMAEAAENGEYDVELSPAGIAFVREALDRQPEHDPSRSARSAADTLRLNAEWMRMTFVTDHGAKRFHDYLNRLGQPEEDIIGRTAFTTAMAERDIRRYIEFVRIENSRERREVAERLWDDQTPEQQAAAFERAEELVRGLHNWWPTDSVPRLYPDDDAQALGTDDIASRLDRVEELAAMIEAANTPDAVREALMHVRVQLETDRSQITRMCAAVAGSAGLMHWQKSVETRDKTLAALKRLEAFVTDEPD